MLVVFLLLFNISSHIVISQDQTEEEEEPFTPTEVSGTILPGVIRRILAQGLFPFFVPLLLFIVTSPYAEPEVIKIGYGERVTIDIGMEDVIEQEWYLFKDDDYHFLHALYLNFEVVGYPGDNKEIWSVNFNPSSIKGTDGELLKTQMTVSLTSPPDASDKVQNGILKVRITEKYAFGNTWIPWNHPEKTPLHRIGWFIAAITAGFGSYTGQTMTSEIDIDILVQVKQNKNIRFEALPLMTIKPGRTAMIPIDINNLGNYPETIGFRLVSDSQDIKISDRSSVTLRPGENKDMFLSVAMPPKLIDFGTLNTVKIQAFSYDQEEVTIAERTVYLESRGIYISELIIAAIVFVLSVLILLFCIILFWRKKTISKFCKKPEKPWKFPEEIKHLEELREKDKKQYEKEKSMMFDEYQSALLWYKNHCQEIVRQKKNERINKKNEKKNKTKNIKQSLLLSKDSKKETKKVKTIKPTKKLNDTIHKKKEKPVKTKNSKIKEKKTEDKQNDDDVKKQIALRKILQQQKKQKNSYR